MKQTSITHEFPRATVIFTNEMVRATGKRMPKLYVQMADAYGYQREWTLAYRYEPGDSKTLYWESSVYQHPGRREAVKLGKAQAEKCIAKFLELCVKYPMLLFNASDEHMPACAGFVHFAEALHRGALPSATML